MVGVGLFIGGNLAAAFFGDAQYRAKRLAGADGFGERGRPAGWALGGRGAWPGGRGAGPAAG